MSTPLVAIIVGLISLIIGGALGAWWTQKQRNERDLKTRSSAEDQARVIIANSETQAQDIVRQAREEVMQTRTEAEKDINRRRSDLNREEDRLQKRREQLDERFEKLEEREQKLNKRQSALDKAYNELEVLKTERLNALERVAEMTREDARAHLIGMVEDETRNDMARKIREVEDEMSSEADNKARELIAMAIQRVASEYVSDVTVSVVPLRRT